MLRVIQISAVVGYNGKDAHGALNWYAPQFLSVGFNTTDINTITLDDGKIGTEEQTVGYGEPMQIVDPDGGPQAGYFFYDTVFAPEGFDIKTPFYWGDESGEPVAVSFDSAEGIAIENGTVGEFIPYQIRSAGEVVKGTVTVAAHGALNWLGNPFPTPIDINAITLDDGKLGTEEQTVGYGEPMQIVDPNGGPQAGYFFYDTAFAPEGFDIKTPFYWGDESGEPVDVTLQPGDGFAIENGTVGEFLTYDIKIACPYSL